MSDQPQFFRHPEMLDLVTVSQQSIIFVGMGSLNSKIVSLLAYPWRQMVLIDPDRMALENVERHHLGLESVGNYKVTGMKRWLVRSRGLKSNSITTHRSKAEKVIQLYPNADLIIEATGLPSLRRTLNAWCYHQNIPAVYAGIYPQGVGGDVIVIPHPRHICYQCFEGWSGKGSEEPIQNYGLRPAGIDMESGELLETPYLSGPVAATAADATELAISLLMGEQLPALQLIQAHRQVPVQWYPPGLACNTIASWVDNQTLLGMIPSMQLVEQAEGFTLSLSRAKICLNIQASAGCPFHYATPNQNGS